MPNKCRTKHVQIRTNAEQKSLKLVACRAHDEQRSYYNVLKTRNATRSMSNYFFTWRKANYRQHASRLDVIRSTFIRHLFET